MSPLNFALFLLPLGDGLVYGEAVGTALTTLDDDARGVRDTLAKAVKRAFDDGEVSEYDALDEPTLLLRSVNLQLAYEGPRSSFPLGHRTRIDVAAVWGHNEASGCIQCYLPLLGTQFHAFGRDRIAQTVEHYARASLDSLEPEAVHRYVMHGVPEVAVVHVQTARRARSHGTEATPLSPLLRRTAEPLPPPRSLTRSRLLPNVAWERGEQVGSLVDTLVRAPANLLLIGDDGVGKSTLLDEVVRRVTRDTRKTNRPRRVFRTSAQRLVADARYLGEWQENLEDLCDELESIGGMLWITDLVQLVATGGAGAADSVAAYLLPRLRVGRAHLLAEMTRAEFEAVRRTLPALLDVFQRVSIEPLDAGAMQRVLQRLGEYSARNLNVSFEPAALARVQALTSRHLKHAAFPAKAVLLFEALVRDARARKLPSIGATDVEATFSRRTGLPLVMLDDRRTLDLAALRETFAARIVGQPEATDALTTVIATYKAGLDDPRRPIATMLFTGPTGVGKTAAASMLGEWFFRAEGGTDPLFRIDMSEYTHPAQVSRLIGDGAATRPSPLIAHLRERPFSVLLLDEIEKAHPAFFDVLLGALDEGRLTDALGRVTDLTNTVIIMTSNLGGAQPLRPGFVQGEGDDTAEAVRAFFRPEFLNRVDGVVRFAALGPAAIRTIARAELAAVAQREGVLARGVTLEFDESVVEHVAKVGFSPRFGARPLQRAIEAEVVAPLARVLLEAGGARPRRIRLTVVDGEVRDTAPGVGSRAQPPT